MPRESVRCIYQYRTDRRAQWSRTKCKLCREIVPLQASSEQWLGLGGRVGRTERSAAKASDPQVTFAIYTDHSTCPFTPATFRCRLVLRPNSIKLGQYRHWDWSKVEPADVYGRVDTDHPADSFGEWPSFHGHYPSYVYQAGPSKA